MLVRASVSESERSRRETEAPLTGYLCLARLIDYFLQTAWASFLLELGDHAWPPMPGYTRLGILVKSFFNDFCQ